MKIIPHNTDIAEVTSETLVISKIEDGVDLLGSLRDFIYESNKGKHICFVANIEDAIEMLSKK